MLENSSILSGSPQTPVDMESDDTCWICLDGTKDRDPLINPCKCPRKVHPRCLARWQLQQAGRPEETNCRFCQCNLADWKASLTPENLKPDVQRVQPIMVVYFEGQIHRIPVKQGPDGLKEFTHRIRELFRLPDDVDISLTFGCKEPLSGQHLKLEGIGAFDAAVHCASVAAAERQQKLKSAGGSADGAGGAASGAAAASDGGAAAPAARGQDSFGALGHAASPRHQQPHLHSHYHNPQERSVSAMDGLLTAASAPSSAQTSGGGADSVVATGGAGLHAAFSAPALSHLASSDSSLLALQSIPRPGSPLVHQESSFAATLNTPSEEPASATHSARTSSGGGSGSSGAVGRTVSVLSQQFAGAAATSAEPFVRQYLLNGGAAAAAAATAGAMAAAGSRAEQLLQQQPQPSQLQLSAAAGVTTPVLSPFQMAALESCRCVGRSSASTISSIISSASSASGSSQPQHHHHHHHMMLSRQQRITPTDSSPAPALALSGEQPALLDAISEPVPSRMGPAAPSTPPAVSYHHQLQQHQAQAPMGSDLSYAGFPYTGVPLPSPTSPYAAPQLPPLSADNGSNNTFSRQQQQQQPQKGNFEEARCAAAASLSPAAVPPTPREHYTASPAPAYDVQSSGNDSPRLTQQQQHPHPHQLQQQHHHHHYHYHYHRHHHHQRTYSQSSGQMHLHRSLPPQLQQSPPHEAQRPEQEPASVSTPSGEPPSTLGSSSAIDSRSPQPAPGTPTLVPAIRASTPSPTTSTPAPVTPQSAPASSRSPPSSPTMSSARQHRYHQHHDEASRPQALYGAAAAVLPASSGGAACEDGGSCGAAVNRPIRRASAGSAFHARQHEYDVSLPCPADDAAALGSLTGRLKYSLRAFSKKVARSLNFQRGVGGVWAGPGACISAHSMVPPLSSVAENDAGEAVEAQAEAEIGTAGGRTDCAAVAAAAAGAAAAVATATAVTVTGPCRQL